jgi:hypothetical protein
MGIQSIVFGFRVQVWLLRISDFEVLEYRVRLIQVYDSVIWIWGLEVSGGSD